MLDRGVHADHDAPAQVQVVPVAEMLGSSILEEGLCRTVGVDSMHRDCGLSLPPPQAGGKLYRHLFALEFDAGPDMPATHRGTVVPECGKVGQE